jgi:hypothetical protein
VQQIQYEQHSGYGSSGGTSGYRYVLMNGSGFTANGGAYAANGSGYRVGYGTAGGTPASGGFYTLPENFPPPVYFQPAYYHSAYGNGRAIVCGACGCALP